MIDAAVLSWPSPIEWPISCVATIPMSIVPGPGVQDQCSSRSKCTSPAADGNAPVTGGDKACASTFDGPSNVWAPILICALECDELNGAPLSTTSTNWILATADHASNAL